MDIFQQTAPNNFNLFLFGDRHDGSILYHKKGWNKLCNMMNSEYCGVSRNFGVDHGDFMESIMIDDVRYDPDTCSNPIPMEQLDNAEIDYEPIADKIVAMCEGNHPWKLWRFGRLTQMLCSRLGVNYGTWSCKIEWVDKKGKPLFKSFHTHGSKGINSYAGDKIRIEANMKEMLKRHLKNKMGDCVLMAKGHTHKLLIQEPTPKLYITNKGKEMVQNYSSPDHTANFIPEDDRFYVNTGSFLKLYGDGVSGYAEKFEYDPIELGFAVAKIRDRKITEIDKVVV
jgi:hypothetical protein